MHAVTSTAKCLLLLIVMVGLFGCGTSQPEPQASDVPGPEGSTWAREMRDNGLGASDIPEARKLLEHPDPFSRVKGLTALLYAREDARAEALNIATSALQDPEWIVRMTALKTIDKLDKDQAKQIARLWINDPEPYIREMAQKVLATN